MAEYRGKIGEQRGEAVLKMAVRGWGPREAGGREKKEAHRGPLSDSRERRGLSRSLREKGHVPRK